MPERTNAGYTIIKSLKIEDVEIVIGENKKRAISPYVTWMCYNDKYYYGHYFEKYIDAVTDLGKRFWEECKRVQESIRRRQK